MLAAFERKLEEVQKLLDALSKELSEGTPAIVEGKKDVEALKKLEATGDIITAKTSGRAFLDVLREVGDRGKNEVILLLDFDERGREWTARLTRDLEGMKVKPNLIFWRRLSSLVGRDVKDIEGLPSYVRRLRERIGKNISNIE